MDESTTQQVYLFICAYIKKHQLPPTLREMAEGCLIATGTLIRHLDRLESLQQISRIPHMARGIVVLNTADIQPEEPLLGQDGF